MGVLDDLCERQRALRMGRPVQVKTEEQGLGQVRDVTLDIETVVLEHSRGDIDDPCRESIRFEVRGDGCEANRVHLENGRRGYEVAHRAAQDGLFAEVVDARGVEQNQRRRSHICAPLLIAGG